MSGEVFERSGAYYDLLYRDKDYAAEVDHVVATLRRAAPTVHSILEFGCGTGKHGRLLAARGFDVVGIERSGSMSKTARAAESDIGTFVCLQGDIRDQRLDRTFDAVLALFHVVSYQIRDGDVRQTFSNAARHLHPHGLFFFDVWHGPAVLSEPPVTREKRVEDKLTCLTRIAEPSMNTTSPVVNVRYSISAENKVDRRITSLQEEHQMRYFFPEEVDFFAREAGFSLERTEEFMTGQAPSARTWSVSYLLRRLD